MLLEGERSPNTARQPLIERTTLISTTTKTQGEEEDEHKISNNEEEDKEQDLSEEEPYIENRCHEVNPKLMTYSGNDHGKLVLCSEENKQRIQKNYV